MTKPSAWSAWCELVPGRVLPLGYDADKTADPGDWFDVEKADHAIGFVEHHCCHVEGTKAGQSVLLEPWQQAFVGAIFGWKRRDGTRRYREVFLYVPRKNGKTLLAAAIGLYVLFFDGEQAAQCYCAAADRDQATIVFRAASGMINQSVAMAEQAEVQDGYKKILLTKDRHSYLKAISSEASSKHGFNTHLGIIDELHAQPNSDLVDALDTSTASRLQPLMIYITTADFERESLCNQKYAYAKKVASREINAREFLPVIYEMPAGMDWKTEEAWRAANPNAGVSFPMERLQTACQKAQDMPTFENTFKRLNLNIRTQQEHRWLSLEAWDACAADVPEAALSRMECYAGLDISSTADITALVLLFPNAGGPGKHVVRCKFWVPGENGRQREKRDSVPYITWERQGLVFFTEGNVIDEDEIEREIVKCSQLYQLREVAYDPWRATTFATRVQTKYGIQFIEFRQGTTSMNEPSNALEAMIKGKQLMHGGNPVLRWMAGNVQVVESGGMIRPDKGASTEKIDGIVSLIMAIGRAKVGMASPVVPADFTLRVIG